MSIVAILSIFVENTDSTEKLNAVLHDYASYIIGRMGIPYRKEKNLSIISVFLDAEQDVINSLSGKIGAINGVTAKTLFAKA